MSTITLVMYSSTSTITFLRTRVRVLKKYSYSRTSTSTRVWLLHLWQQLDLYDTDKCIWLGLFFDLTHFIYNWQCCKLCSLNLFMQAPTQVKSNDDKKPNEWCLFIIKLLRKTNVGSTPQGHMQVSCTSGWLSPCFDIYGTLAVLL